MVVVAQQLSDAAENVVGNEGFYVDVTPSGLLLKQEERDREQSIDDGHAFELLRWRSQLTNTKLVRLAEQFRDDITEIDYAENLPPRATFDQVLLAAHGQIKPDLAS